MAKKAKPTTPPARQDNVIVIPRPLNVATGHRPHMTGSGPHRHKCWKRLNTRQAQVQRAFKDW